MKESTLIQMKNKLDKLDQAMGILYMELNRLNERVAQMQGIIHGMPGYEEAVKKFAEEIQEHNEKAKAAQENEENLKEDGESESKLDLGKD